MFESVLIANRGEIAVRIIRTLHRMGIRAVALYSDVDIDARHVLLADEAVPIGPPQAYLDADRVVAAAVATGVQAIHPGYGFLSENATLARLVTEAGITFVGPPAEAIELMGDKINAKRTVAAAGVPVVPGRDEADLSDADLASAARQIGLPVLLKPSAGGGGKGMRKVADPAELAGAIAAARREAIGAFGDGTLLVERYIDRPRHIEVQIFADTLGRTVSLGERECSLQRRHQKIVEEAPSPMLDEPTRAAMSASAVAVAESCGYTGAGTVEFIVSADRPGDYYFMEMNTRLQVEHPVTEMVLDLDLVELQLRVAAGEPLPWPADQSPPRPRGHAIEARVYAEDPRRGFLPASGTVIGLEEPTDMAHVRVDSALAVGTVVGTDYDPMLSKVVAWGADRGEALARLAVALRSTAVLGVTTNVGFLGRLIADLEVVAGRLDTDLVERVSPDLQPDPAPDCVVAAAALLEALLDRPTGPVIDPWYMADGWRLSGASKRRSEWRIAGRDVSAELVGSQVSIDGGPREPAQARLTESGRLRAEYGGRTATYVWARRDDGYWLAHDGDVWSLARLRETIERSGPASAGDGSVTSPMPGTVLQVHVVAGDPVRVGQPLVSVEAMKMEHVVTASITGTVTSVLVRVGESVRLDQPLAVLEVAPDGDQPS